MSKGKANKDYSIFVEIGGSKEELVYRCAPCNGVKICSQSDCNFVAPVSRLRSCPDHPDAKLKQSNEMSPTKCPVEFAYNIFPKDTDHDNRQWIMGYVRQQKVQKIYIIMPFLVEQRCVHLLRKLSNNQRA